MSPRLKNENHLTQLEFSPVRGMRTGSTMLPFFFFSSKARVFAVDHEPHATRTGPGHQFPGTRNPKPIARSSQSLMQLRVHQVVKELGKLSSLSQTSLVEPVRPVISPQSAAEVLYGSGVASFGIENLSGVASDCQPSGQDFSSYQPLFPCNSL